MFYVGQKVVCVEEDQAPTLLTKGRVYTVGKVWDPVAISVAEIDLTHTHWFGFRKRYFRPVVERKTDISIFTEMLHRRVVEVDA